MGYGGGAGTCRNLVARRPLSHPPGVRHIALTVWDPGDLHSHLGPLWGFKRNGDMNGRRGTAGMNSSLTAVNTISGFLLKTTLMADINVYMKPYKS